MESPSVPSSPGHALAATVTDRDHRHPANRLLDGLDWQLGGISGFAVTARDVVDVPVQPS
jgi:hypothetical protein